MVTVLGTVIALGLKRTIAPGSPGVSPLFRQRLQRLRPISAPYRPKRDCVGPVAAMYLIMTKAIQPAQKLTVGQLTVRAQVRTAGRHALAAEIDAAMAGLDRTDAPTVIDAVGRVIDRYLMSDADYQAAYGSAD